MVNTTGGVRVARAAWEAEFADYFTARAAPLRRLAYALCGDWHAAEDVVQTAFVKLYRAWRRVRPESMDAYVRRIVVNTYLSHRRDRRRESVLAEPPDPGAPPDPDAGMRVDVARALATLPARQRAMVVLRHLEDLSVAEVSDLLGIAEGTVKSQTARGVQALRQALGAPALSNEP
jgi:RNA polymerase sigma-70 factor (sigma-E family)